MSVDTLGPASATNSVTVRPTESTTYGATDTWFKPCSSPTTNDGTQLKADWLNNVLAQLRTVLTDAGDAKDNADDMLWRALRRMRLYQDRVTVGAGGVTLSLATNSKTYYLDLATRQTMQLPNPAALPAGYSVIIETTGLPSGFQTAFVSVAAGAGSTAIYYRAIANDVLRLIGNGEVFLLVNSGSTWFAYCLAPPGRIVVWRTKGSGGATPVPTSYTEIALDTSAGFSANFSVSSGHIAVPVTGIYDIDGGVTGGSSDGVGRGITMALTRNTITPAAPNDILTTGSVQTVSTFSLHAHAAVTEQLQQGDTVYLLVAGDTNASYIPSSAHLSVSLIGR